MPSKKPLTHAQAKELHASAVKLNEAREELNRKIEEAEALLVSLGDIFRTRVVVPFAKGDPAWDWPTGSLEFGRSGQQGFRLL